MAEWSGRINNQLDYVDSKNRNGWIRPRRPILVQGRNSRHSRSASEWRRTKPCTVKRKMSLITALSDAELMSTRTSSAERMESTSQGLRKLYMSALYRTWVRGHSGSRKTRKSGQRTKPGSMSMSFPSGRGRWWSNICQTIPLTFYFNKPAGGTRPKKSWVTRMVIYGPGKFYLVNNDVSRRNDCFKRKETPQNGN